MVSHSEIFQKLKSLHKQDVQCMVATFVSYEKATSTITVQLPNGLKIPGIRLKASVDKKVDYYSIIVPRAKSTVLIGQIGSSAEAGEYYLISCDEFEKVEMKADKMMFKVDKNGVELNYNAGMSTVKLDKDGKLLIEKGAFNLHDVLKELLDSLKSMKVLVIGTAGQIPLTITQAGTHPSSISDFATVWAKLDDILTNGETV
jgi:hypothetical protein